MASLDFFTFETDEELAALLPVFKTIPLPSWETVKYAFRDESGITFSSNKEFAVQVLEQIANSFAEINEYRFVSVNTLAAHFGDLTENWATVLKVLISLQTYGYVIIVERKSTDGYQTRLYFSPTEKLAQYLWDNYLDGNLVLK